MPRLCQRCTRRFRGSIGEAAQGSGLLQIDQTSGPPARSSIIGVDEKRSTITSTGARARVFTVEEELPFARHPVLGAAAVLHRTLTPDVNAGSWILKLPGSDVPVSTTKFSEHFLAEMNQGAAIVGGDIGAAQLQPVLARLDLQSGDRVDGFSAQVISPGLPYLILPVHGDASARAKRSGTDLELFLTAQGAKFILLLDVAAREIATWDNFGEVEDVATGSAAGPAATYLINHGCTDPSASLALAQGRFAGRPSKILVRRDRFDNLFVSDEVGPVAHGFLEVNALQMDV